MDALTITVSMIGIIGTLSSIFFAYLAFKKRSMDEEKNEGKNEGRVLSDICYIKSCVEQALKNLNKVDERYRDILERLVRVEETVANVIKRMDGL